MTRARLMFAMLIYNVCETVQVIAGDVIRAEQSRRWARAEKRRRARAAVGREWN